MIIGAHLTTKIISKWSKTQTLARTSQQFKKNQTTTTFSWSKKAKRPPTPFYQPSLFRSSGHGSIGKSEWSVVDGSAWDRTDATGVDGKPPHHRTAYGE